MKTLGVVCCMLVLLHVCSSETEDRNARLLVAKEVVNNYGMIVEGKEVILQYSLYNVGGSAALKVQLVDNSIQPTDMEVLHGLVRVAWDRIPPSGNVTHTVVVRPLRPGYMNFSSAEVSYFSSEDAADPQYAYTSAPGIADVVTFREFDRRFNPHIVDWLAFAVMTLPSLGIPFLLWYSSKSKYDRILRQSKKAH